MVVYRTYVECVYPVSKISEETEHLAVKGRAVGHSLEIAKNTVVESPALIYFHAVEIIIAAIVLFTIFGEQTHCVIIALHARSSHTVAAYGNFVSIRAALISDRNCKHYRHRGRNIFADF